MKGVDPMLLVGLFVDGELPAEAASAFMELMHNDPQLARAVEEARETKEMLKDALAVEGPTEEQKERARNRILAVAFQEGFRWRYHFGGQMELPLDGQLKLINE